MLLVRKQRDEYIRILQEKTALSDDLTKGVGGSRHIYAFLSMLNSSNSAARLNIPPQTIPDHDARLPYSNTVKNWELLELEELWREKFSTLDEFKKAIGFAEIVKPILILKNRSTPCSTSELLANTTGPSGSSTAFNCSFPCQPDYSFPINKRL